MGFNYNWSNLSDHDFEGVCRDVMAADLGGPVEAFARGQDGGVDLRWGNGRGLIIGQSKHYLRSTYAKLLSSIKDEKGKMDKLSPRPSRYILYTSMALSPSRKTELRKAMLPYVRADSDIVGLEELEGFLASHPDIEAHHYKLWLSSVRVLDRIMGNATLSRSEIRVEEIVDRAKFFVPHDRMRTATDILWKEHCLIISGPRGIGKTTMAEMLALRFLEHDYKLYFVVNVEELEQRLRSEDKQVFVYDDFLGRTNFREAPDATSQERLFHAMRYIAKKPGKYFILTTREYLYREAHAANERLAASRADLVRCLLDVDGYDDIKRAQILYNHLYWTPGIPDDALRKFVADKAHWGIINHPNFNPRWIADTLNRIAEPTATEAPPWT